MTKQRTALVTGAAGGLGRAWVRKLIDEDFHVYMAARTMEKAELAAIEGGYPTAGATPLAIDVTNQAHMASAAALIKQQFGRLDVLINNAGYMAQEEVDLAAYTASHMLGDLDEDELLKSYQINAFGPLFMMKHFEGLLSKGVEKKILHMGSTMGSLQHKTKPGRYGYCGSKQALVMLNKTAALELKEKGITSVVCCPGWVQTRMGGKMATLRPTSAVEHLFHNVLMKLNDFETGAYIDREGQSLA